MQRSTRLIQAKLLVDADHYDELIAREVKRATVSVWIATANLKTMLVEAPVGTRARAQGRYVSFFESLSDLARRGVDVRILHASLPSRPLRRQLSVTGRTKESAKGSVATRRCPRVHLKMIAIDGRLLYLGSANLTGAGLGAKGEGKRNFEMGIVTDDDATLDAAQERFDRIWRGAECSSCKLRRTCDAPLDSTLATLDAGPSAPRTPKRSASGRSDGGRERHAVTSPGSSTRTRRSPSSPR